MIAKAGNINNASKSSIIFLFPRRSVSLLQEFGRLLRKIYDFNL